MSWEALRLTSRTPSEVYAVLGPHGVEELLTKARDAVWRETPETEREFQSVRQRLIDVFERNMKVWRAIKKPTPEAFFANLLPHAADGHIRQALVLSWMMMPRAGGRDFAETVKITRTIFDRILAAWDEDNRTFTGTSARKTRARPGRAGSRKPTAARPGPRSKSSKPPLGNNVRKSAPGRRAKQGSR